MGGNVFRNRTGFSFLFIPNPKIHNFLLSLLLTEDEVFRQLLSVRAIIWVVVGLGCVKLLFKIKM